MSEFTLNLDIAPARINYANGGKPNAAEMPGIVFSSPKAGKWLEAVHQYWKSRISQYFGIRGLLVSQPYFADRQLLVDKLEELEKAFEQNGVPYKELARVATVIWSSHGITRRIQLLAGEVAIQQLLATFSAERSGQPETPTKKTADKPEIPAVAPLEL